MSQTKKIAHVYNPDNQTRQELLDNFVVRLPVFEKLFHAIKDSRMETTEQHFLIQGQRGTGKTTLLLKLAYEIENDPALAKWLIPVRLNEEQYHIFSLCRLWESVTHQLEERPGFEDLPDIYEKSFADEDYPQHCFKILEKRLQREKKKVVLLIDNIADVLKKIGEKECRQLRDILHTTTEIRIIAASARTLEHYFRHDKPFYEFFKPVYLDGLNQKETGTLLLKLADNYQRPQVREIIEKYPGRVETLRRLTGGIPRTIILLFEIFVDDSANVFEDLELILDRITPLYKHRMDDLSGQQQAIMDAIAMHWDAIATREIAQKVRMDSKAVAAQLKILEKNNLIHAIPADKKNNLYLISERFFNIWYLMRYGRKQNREQVRFLVRFLEEWCSPEELVDRINKHISLARANGLHSKGAYYMCEALAQCAPTMELQHKLILSTKEYLTNASPELAKSLSPSDLELAKHAVSLLKEKDDYPAALRSLEKISRPNETVWTIYGVLYWLYANDPGKAEGYFQMAADKGYAEAMYDLAELYWQERNDLGATEKFYRMAADKGHTKAMYQLAKLYRQELDDLVSAEKYYRMAAEMGDTNAMTTLGNLSLREGHTDLILAEKYYRMAIKKGHTGAMNNLGNLYRIKYQDTDKAQKYYRMAAKKGETLAMNNLATLCWDRNDLNSAEKYYRMAANKGDTDAMVGLADLYWEGQQDPDTAEKYYRMAAENGNEGAKSYLAIFYLLNNKSKNDALRLAQEAAESSKTQFSIYVLATCLLWHNFYADSINTFRQFLEYQLDHDAEYAATFYLVFLLAKKQQHRLVELFRDKRYRLKELFKPVYFALMQRMQNEYPKEYKKMGAELRQTVEEILAEADKMAKDYA